MSRLLCRIICIDVEFPCIVFTEQRFQNYQCINLRKWSGRKTLRYRKIKVLSLAENLTTHGWNIISQPSQTQSTTVGILLSELGLIPSSSEQRVCQSCVIEESSRMNSLKSVLFQKVMYLLMLPLMLSGIKMGIPWIQTMLADYVFFWHVKHISMMSYCRSVL